MSADLEQLRREHADQVIGPELQRLLEGVVRATARTYPPAEYSDSGTWDSDALADALQDWVEARLLRRGDLSKMLTAAPSVAGLRGALTRSFEQFLANRRRRTSATNLYQRTTKILREDSTHFARVGQARRSHEQLWTVSELAGMATGSSRLSIPSLVAIASELSDDDLEVVRYGAMSLKSSPILREAKLREFLVHLLGRAEGALDQTTIAEVMRRRFGLVELEVVALEEHDVGATAVELRHVDQDDVVASVLTRLGRDRLDELRQFHTTDADPDDLPSAVSDTIALVAQYADSAEAAEEIYDRLVESLF
jgi:hypothetical protein